MPHEHTFPDIDYVVPFELISWRVPFTAFLEIKLDFIKQGLSTEELVRPTLDRAICKAIPFSNQVKYDIGYSFDSYNALLLIKNDLFKQEIELLLERRFSPSEDDDLFKAFRARWSIGYGFRIINNFTLNAKNYKCSLELNVPCDPIEAMDEFKKILEHISYDGYTKIVQVAHEKYTRNTSIEVTNERHLGTQCMFIKFNPPRDGSDAGKVTDENLESELYQALENSGVIFKKPKNYPSNVKDFFQGLFAYDMRMNGKSWGMIARKLGLTRDTAIYRCESTEERIRTGLTDETLFPSKLWEKLI